MGRLVKVLVLTILISSLGMINLPPATADGVVDQSNLQGIAAVFAEIGTAPPVIGQTFTPTVPDIVAVDIFLRGGDSTVLLDIFIANNVPNSVTFRADFNPGCPCDITVPIHVDFTGVLTNPLTVGSTNIITIQHSAGSSDTLTEWAGSAANAYAPGSAQGPGSDATINDFFFRTYFLFVSGVGLAMDLQAGCILTVNSATANFGAVSPPSPGIATFNFQNDGSGILAVSADVGDNVNGGMQDSVPEVTILPQDMTIDATDTFDLTPGTATMLNAGTPVLIANLQPLSSFDEGGTARVGTITAATTNLQNLPASGALTGTLTLTGGACT